MEHASPSPARTLHVAILGGGVVGGGVVEILRSRHREFQDALGLDFRILFVAVRSAGKERDFVLPAGAAFTTDPVAAATSDAVDVVMECMGGTGLAREAVMAALEQGKSVVTANKALLSAHLEEVAAAAVRGGGALCYEAAVCGGIPIVKAMQRDLVADEVLSVSGVLNGTTNYILTRMEREGIAYADALGDAKRLGYAEADPTADVCGFDARSKALLLAVLAFGRSLREADVALEGIARLRSVDFDLLRPAGRTLRLVGACRRRADRGALSLAVCPVAVPRAHPLAQAAGPANRVVVQGRHFGEIAWTGPGAGRFPTAASMVADLVEIGRGRPSEPFPRGLGDGGDPIERDLEGRFYVRAGPVTSAEAAARVAEDSGVPIESTLARTLSAPAGPGGEREGTVGSDTWAAVTGHTTWSAVAGLIARQVDGGILARAEDAAFALLIE